MLRCRWWSCWLLVAARGLAAVRRRATTDDPSQARSASRCPAFALPPRSPDRPGLAVRRPRRRPAAAAQRLRQLVRAVHRRGAACCANSKRRGVPIDGIAIRDRPEDVAAFLAAPRQSVRAHRRRRHQPGAAGARLVGRARDLRRRWPGRDPLPAHRRSSAQRRADDPGRALEAGAMKRCVCSSRCSLLSPRPRCADSDLCRRRLTPIASSTTRRRRPRRRR